MRRLEVLTVSCPPGTPEAAPLETDFSFAPGDVERVEIRIPPGHAFLTGIALAQAHEPTIPWTDGAFLIGDDERLGWDIDDPISSGGWSVFTYNTDPVYAHLWQIRWTVRDLATKPRPRPIAPISVGEIHALAGQLDQIGHG